MEARRTERFRGSGYGLGAVGGVILLLGLLTMAFPLVVAVLGLTVGLGAVGGPMLLTGAAMLLGTGGAPLLAIMLGTALLSVAAWLARDLPVADDA